MKTKQLTFLLSLTFLFLFSGSVLGQEKEVEQSDRGQEFSEIRCGNYLIQVKEDLSDKRFKFLYLVFTDDKGNKFNSETGVRISEVKCLDLTGDKNPDLFVELWQGGQRAASFDSYVYLLENEIV